MGNKTKLKEIQMVNIYLMYIQPEALGLAINNVEAVYISDTQHFGYTFSHDQINGVFNAMSKQTTVKNLMLRDIDISKVEPVTMASAISKLDELMMWRTFRTPFQSELSESQCKALFDALSKKTNLKRMVMMTKHMNQVEPITFAKALNYLEKANFMI